VSAIIHDWDLTPKQAIALQQRLAAQVLVADRFDNITRVAGVDVGFEQQGKITRAAVAVLSFPELQLIDSVIARRDTSFPYIPGLLSFREIPAVLEALAKLKKQPDLLLCDGQGIAHPRRFGIASHLGILVDLPSIGVAKSRLYGRHETVPDNKGAHTPLLADNETIGAVLRTRVNVKPLYISVGHRISLVTALHYVMACVSRYRLPETIRYAHRLASG